ncbi:MAG: hypothetical protein GY715_14995 [Planctomycetes bacterium]|nr:hypothetical protein [Planctomycetota bacterium]
MLGWIAALLIASGSAPADDDLRTVAETSDYRATARHADVLSLLARLDARSDRMSLVELGRTSEGRAIPLAIVADPPAPDAATARGSGRLVVLAFGNIHAGEVCGKEALLMLARELTGPERDPLLDDLVLLLVPNLNPDGNERVKPGNRPGQIGPAEGMGQHPNAQGLDLNRDWTKLESPEVRALVRLLTEWDPDLTIDTHTTNGSHHRYVLTYAPPLNPSGHGPSIAFVRDDLLPEVSRRLLARTGHDTFFYGDFDRAHETWSTYSANPRFGGPYRGLRGHMSILSEAYSYAPYRDRVHATLEFVREILSYAAEHRARVAALHTAAREEVIVAGRSPQPDDCVGIRHAAAAFVKPAVVKGWEMVDVPGTRPKPTTRPRDYTVVHRGRFEPTVCVQRPWAYIIPPGHGEVVAKLHAHGIETRPFEGAARTETYSVTAVGRADREFQGHRLATIDVTTVQRDETFPAGSTIVQAAQPLGTLAVCLLEPQATDGLAAWGLIDVAVGQTYSVRRVSVNPESGFRNPESATPDP